MDLSRIAKRTAGSANLYFRRNGPTILTAAGVAGFLATTYLTGKAVLDSRLPISELKSKQRKIMETQIDQDYTKAEKAKELSELWRKEVPGIVKIYAPAVITGGVAIFCVVASHNMQRSQRAALIAAYGALDAGFRAYRKRVEEVVGASKELELYRGPRVQRELKEGEEGEIGALDLDTNRSGSVYARFFDESCPEWNKNPEYSLLFLLSQEKWANNLLQSRGHVFLNEVYDAIGIKRSEAGQVVGWRLDGPGDHYISFGIHDITDESSRAFVNGYETVILLDFNVDGVILTGTNPRKWL